MKCPNCGNDIPSAAKFCPKCGTSIPQMPVEGLDHEDSEQSAYILPESDSRYLDAADLYDLSEEECRLARNELYARHGRKFDDEGLRAYFESKDWYSGTIDPSDFKEGILNDYEVYNRDLIVEYEKEQGYR